MTLYEIINIPIYRYVTYAHILYDYISQKEYSNQVISTVGGHLIEYPGKLTTRESDLITEIFLWNSTISTPVAHYMGTDVKTFTWEHLCIGINTLI